MSFIDGACCILTTGATKDLLVQSDRGPGAWSDSIGNAFLAPYELNADKSTFSVNGTKAPVHTALAKIDAKTYYYQGAVDGNTVNNVSRYVPTSWLLLRITPRASNPVFVMTLMVKQM